MTEKNAKRQFNIAVVLGIILILVLAVFNFRLWAAPILQFLRGQIDFRQMTEDAAANYVSDAFAPKNESITLNGLFARAAGRRVYNGVTLMNNGMLTGENVYRREMTDTAEKIISLASFVRERSGTRFLFAAPPYKIPFEGDTLLPVGRKDFRDANFDELLRRLKDAGFSVLDLRPDFSANQAFVEKYMYRTDPHWNNDAAIEAFGRVMNGLENLLGEELDKSCADLTGWERHEEKDFWLGATGKRVGPLFAGTDSLVYYTPKFDTAMSYAYYRQDGKFGFLKGDFTSICVFDGKFTRGDWYKTNGSQVYMNQLHPLVVHRNLNAPNRQRIMVVGDSFCQQGLQAFLATEFAEVHMIDPRFDLWFSLAEYAEWTRPDVLLMLTSTLEDDFIHDYGADRETEWLEAHPGSAALLQGESFTVISKDSKKNAVELPVPLQQGEVYHLSFRSAEAGDEATDCATAVLYDRIEGKEIQTAIFDLEYGNRTGRFTCAFSVPEDDPEAEYTILLCPGIWKETPETAMTFFGVSLEQEV